MNIRILKLFGVVCLLAMLASGGMAAETGGFLSQTITLPAERMQTRFADLNKDGRFSLLALDPVARQLLIYRQGVSGFKGTPDQVIELPPRAAWVAPYAVETTSNLDLLMSTATGLVYYRQNGHLFESEPRVLLKIDQVFTNDDPPGLILFGTNAAIPVITATQAWWYGRNENLEWTSSPPVTLEENKASWSYRIAWMMGPKPAPYFYITQSFQSQPAETNNDKPENDTIDKLMSDMKKAGPWNQPEIARVDLDGDGQKDFILWQVLPDKSFRTDVYVFLRRADGKLPEKPTQVLHCRGTPIPIGSLRTRSPIADLKGDGQYELVLLEPDVTTFSVGGLLDMALSRGMKWTLTVRPFNHGMFSQNADAAVSFKSFLSLTGLAQWTFFIYGDYNGDGRPDLVTLNTSDQWNIFLSTNNGHWFQPEPAMSFRVPLQGYYDRRYFEIADLNGDGRSDIVSHGIDDPRIFIFLTQPQHAKGNP